MQISIPQNIIDDIMRKHNCTREEAIQAFVRAQERAAGAFNQTIEEYFSKDEGTEAIPQAKVFTPREIKTHLDRFVIGQEEYKKRICIAASYHFAMVRYLRENREKQEIRRFRKKNTIIAGPSGSGKTYCAEVLGDLLQVPTLIIDSTDYTEAGYVGKSADDMIRELIDMAPGKNRKEQVRFIVANGGMIFIDEIDKKAREGGIVGHDISREGFQRSVLKLMERKLVPVDNPYSPASQIEDLMERQQGVSHDDKEKMINTDNILFILGGSFERSGENLEKIVRKRIEHGGNLNEEGGVIIRGFEAVSEGGDHEKYKNYYREAESDDYIHFGLLPELVGRAPIRTFVNLLSKNDLIRIMNETEDSILTQYRLEFRLFGIDLEFTQEAIDYVAGLAENHRTGARALVSVWENILTDFQFEIPGSHFKKVTVTRELCERPRDVLLHMLEKSPFLDFMEGFHREYGIELAIDEEAQAFMEEVARREKTEISATIKRMLSGASALNYMHYKGSFRITKEMLEDPAYFDHLFAEWYQKQKQPEGTEPAGEEPAGSANPPSGS